MFDFRKIRDDRSRWDALLSALGTREQEITRQAANRAASLLPADRPVSVTTRSRSPSACPAARITSSCRRRARSG